MALGLLPIKEHTLEATAQFNTWQLTCVGALVLILLIWAYWPTIGFLIDNWSHEPDYSHGYLVLPLAVAMLWVRRDQMPQNAPHAIWPGFGCMIIATIMRFVAARYYASSIDAWSILVWLAGIVWLVGGWRLFKWSLPSLAFLLFMIPLPYRVERWLALPLQTVATQCSCWVLQTVGQPAISEGHQILIGDRLLDVAEACSGLRIFVAIVALAYAVAFFRKRQWWERLLILASSLPVAIIANLARIVITLLLQTYTSSETARSLGHDFAGLITIPFAVLLFAVLLWYIGQVFPMVTLVQATAGLQTRSTRSGLRE